MTFIDTDKYEFDFIWSYGKQYIEITHHYKNEGRWNGWTRFCVKIEDKIILWDDTHPASKEAVAYIEKTYKNKAFI